MEWKWIARSVMKMEVLIMLVLSRKCQEAVVVGGADGLEALLKVTVLGIDKRQGPPRL